MKVKHADVAAQMMAAMISGLWSLNDFDFSDSDDSETNSRVFREHAKCLARDARVYADALVEELGRRK